jgi:hypothetical protein
VPGVFTPIYGWPYQTLADRPDGPNLGQGGFLGVEATMAAIDTRLAAIEAAASYRDAIVTSGTVASVTFSGIPSTLRAVRIDYTARTDDANHTTNVMCRINADAGANYNHALMFTVNGGAPAAGNAIGVTRGQIGACIGASATAGKFGGGHVVFPGWNSPHSACLVGKGFGGAISAIGNSVIVGCALTYLVAGPYTQITLIPEVGNFVIGSGFYLEGLR